MENLGGTVGLIIDSWLWIVNYLTPRKFIFFVGLFYVYTRTAPSRNLIHQRAQCPSRTRKSLGNFLATKDWHHRHNIFCYDTCLLGTGKRETILKCPHPNSRIWTFNTINGVGEETIYWKWIKVEDSEINSEWHILFTTPINS